MVPETYELWLVVPVFQDVPRCSRHDSTVRPNRPRIHVYNSTSELSSAEQRLLRLLRIHRVRRCLLFLFYQRYLEYIYIYTYKWYGLCIYIYIHWYIHIYIYIHIFIIHKWYIYIYVYTYLYSQIWGKVILLNSLVRSILFSGEEGVQSPILLQTNGITLLIVWNNYAP